MRRALITIYRNRKLEPEQHEKCGNGIIVPEQHYQKKKVSKKTNNDEDAVEDDDGDEEPGVTVEQLSEMGLCQVNSFVAVKICQQLSIIN